MLWIAWTMGGHTGLYRHVDLFIPTFRKSILPPLGPSMSACVSLSALTLDAGKPYGFPKGRGEFRSVYYEGSFPTGGFHPRSSHGRAVSPQAFALFSLPDFEALPLGLVSCSSSSP
jgi:hypothetical protein